MTDTELRALVGDCPVCGWSWDSLSNDPCKPGDCARETIFRREHEEVLSFLSQEKAELASALASWQQSAGPNSERVVKQEREITALREEKAELERQLAEADATLHCHFAADPAKWHRESEIRTACDRHASRQSGG